MPRLSPSASRRAWPIASAVSSTVWCSSMCRSPSVETASAKPPCLPSCSSMWSKKPRPVLACGSRHGRGRARPGSGSRGCRARRWRCAAHRPAHVRSRPVPLPPNCGCAAEAADAEVAREGDRRSRGRRPSPNAPSRCCGRAVAAWPADAGLARGLLSAGRLRSISTSRKVDALALEDLQQQPLRSFEVGFGEGFGAQSVLVADHHELVAGVAQPKQCRHHPRDEAQLVVGGRSGSPPAPRSGFRRGR
jgi:hypothetical protein